MSEKLVSVVLPIYNGEKFLRETVESIVSQSYQKWELLVVDDCSTDASVALVEKIVDGDPRVAIHRLPENRGISGATNFGFGKVTGDFVAMHDQDDISYPQRFEMQVKRFDERPEVGIIGTSFDLIDEHSKKFKFVRPPLSEAEIREWILFSSPFCSPSVMFRRRLLDTGICLEPEFDLAQDYRLYGRLYKGCGLENLSDSHFGYRIHPNQGSAQAERQQDIATRISRELLSNDVGDWINSVSDSDLRKMRFLYLEPGSPICCPLDIRALGLMKKILNQREKGVALESLQSKLNRCVSLKFDPRGEAQERDFQKQDYHLVGEGRDCHRVKMSSKVRFSKLLFTKIALEIYKSNEPLNTEFRFVGGDKDGYTSKLGDGNITVRLRGGIIRRKKTIELFKE